MSSYSNSMFSTGFRERPQKRNTYRLNANNIDFDFLRKNITSYLGGGASVHPAVRIMNGEEYYLYDAARPLIPSQVRDIEVDSAEHLERSSASARSHHRRVGSGGSRGRRWRRRRRDSPPPIIQLDVNIFMNGHSIPTATINRSMSSTPVEHHRGCQSAAAAAAAVCPPNQQRQQHQPPRAITSTPQQPPSPPTPAPAPQHYEHTDRQRQQLAAMFTPAITPPPVEFYQPKPSLRFRTPSVSSLSAVSACSSPKTFTSSSGAAGDAPIAL
ncbi:hypothetical protein BZA05DRAFT_385385 [Tricharina praecox]|uniref:uncharacterized protein n=1 Tax=Tricharina praecox TaxID=43433 RepID=UPI0022209496|nr:uncharacterized protein BZA05DRAFT_385385 [Tricharina praecox]KAI5857966.1 hypothetical protein BZA05DRAFT_385385 [Tricharina praecox]